MQRSFSGAFCALAMLVLFAGLFVQITMLARVSEKGKQASTLEREILRLGVEADNLELSINQYHNLERISILARELGMEESREGQIRAVHVDMAADSPDEQAGRDGI